MIGWGVYKPKLIIILKSLITIIHSVYEDLIIRHKHQSQLEACMKYDTFID